MSAEVAFADFTVAMKDDIRSHLGILWFMHHVTGAQITFLDEFLDVCYDWGIKIRSPVDTVIRPRSLVEPVHGTHDLYMDVLAVSATHVRNNEDLSAGIPITFTLDAQPDVPRTLSGHFDSHVNITEYIIDIVGVNAKGITIIETKTESTE